MSVKYCKNVAPIQQGDVFMRKIENIPSSVKKVNRSHRGYVLAEGEVTGHAHVIGDDIDLFENENNKFFSSDKEVELVHEEHGNVKIPEGNWEVRIVQEYDHFAEEAKRVAD